MVVYSFSIIMENEAAPTQSKDPLALTIMDTDILVRHVTDTGKILPRRITGYTARQQRHLGKTIRKARSMLLMK